MTDSQDTSADVDALPPGIPATAVTVRFVRSSGPGGQNVNKVATAVQLRLNVADTELPDAVQARLLDLAGDRATKSGDILIRSETFRSQARNRADAFARLHALVERARAVRKPRRPTNPSKAVKRRRLDAKGQRSSVKRLRRKPDADH